MAQETLNVSIYSDKLTMTLDQCLCGHSTHFHTSQFVDLLRITEDS